MQDWSANTAVQNNPLWGLRAAVLRLGPENFVEDATFFAAQPYKKFIIYKSVGLHHSV